MSAIRLKIKAITHKALIDYKRYFVKKQWRKVAEKYATGYKLNEKEKREVDKIFGPYMKVTYKFHEYIRVIRGCFLRCICRMICIITMLTDTIMIGKRLPCLIISVCMLIILQGFACRRRFC